MLADERVAMVKYCSPEGARLAVGNLNGTEVRGLARAAAAARAVLWLKGLAQGWFRARA